MSEIKNAISTLVGIEDMVYFDDCEVISTNEGERTCIVQNGVNEIVVRLMTVVDDGVLIMPKIGSIVSVLQSDKYDPIIVQFSEVEKIILMGGDNKGLVKVIELKNKLNAVENKINDLITKINSWTPVPNDGGSALKIALATWLASSLTPTQQADIENTLIQH